jgi:hypothetical protein
MATNTTSTNSDGSSTSDDTTGADGNAHETDASTENQNRTGTTVSAEGLLARERTLAFCGLNPEDDASYPDAVDPTNSDGRLSDDALSFKEVVRHLPIASSGDLYADNRFVGEDGTINTAAIRDVDGLNTDAIEQATGMSVEEIATEAAQRDSLIEVSDHQNIIDERRLALHTLGLPVKFRWQIASDQYCIVQPADAYMPTVGALQKRGATDAFGWAHYRDWGGTLKMSVVLPDLRRTLIPPEDDDDEGDGGDDEDDSDPASRAQQRDDALIGATGDESDGEGVTVYGGFQTGYDFRGSQTMWARPLLYVPASDVAIFGMGQRYSRRHVGSATDAIHERKNDRVPINEWWGNIYDDIENQTTTVDRAILRSRAVAIDFEDVPYSVDEFYTYLGIPGKYAEEAADRAKTFASPPTSPTIWNLQLSLLVALDALYEGSHASDTYQDYNEVAQQLLRQPAHSIQLALKEHDLRADENTAAKQLPPDQQSLSDAIEDLATIPGVDADTETDLSNVDAQRIQEGVSGGLQQKLDELG